MNNDPRPQQFLLHYRSRLLNRISLRAGGLTIAALALGACAPLASQQQTATPSLPQAGSQALTQTHCAGAILPPYGLTPISDPALVAKAQQPPTKGGLCMGEAFQTTQPLTVYRVWDSSKPLGQYGSWWSFNPPAGPRDAYRVQNEICPSWSKLDRVTQCRLKVGSEIVIGPGQSAQCGAQDNNASYPTSAAIQVYVPNDTSSPSKEFVSDCIAATAWPE
ncbi:hypothetical protein [Trinickia dinghuensis]|uniref:Uncharacterized protein n=1 Tax=Trinickia dinghuensis TaxID=2291023 RepID=A0A3D8K1I2_9BURK|nr:hypothetical protein [Trinickia dinghuensis]RDU98980.1 hypothetical protein DWV00_12130 [Trinickia dinghuensis]